jgi:hypothetical protein
MNLLGDLSIFLRTCCKKILQKVFSMKKSKCSEKAHLWLSRLPLLARLTMIAPKNQGLLNNRSLINLTSLHQDFKPLEPLKIPKITIALN